MYRSDAAKAVDLPTQFLGWLIRKVRATIAKAAGPVIRRVARMVGRVVGR
jgi:hypothetical protein